MARLATRPSPPLAKCRRRHAHAVRQDERLGALAVGAVERGLRRHSAAPRRAAWPRLVGPAAARERLEATSWLISAATLLHCYRAARAFHCMLPRGPWRLGGEGWGQAGRPLINAMVGARSVAHRVERGSVAPSSRRAAPWLRTQQMAGVRACGSPRIGTPCVPSHLAADRGDAPPPLLRWRRGAVNDRTSLGPRLKRFPHTRRTRSGLPRRLLHRWSALCPAEAWLVWR